MKFNHAFSQVYTFSNITKLIFIRKQICSTIVKIDVIITDQTMPSFTGFELSQELLKIRSDIKIILITGFSKNLKRKRALESGIRIVLMKPFNIEELATKLRVLVD